MRKIVKLKRKSRPIQATTRAAEYIASHTTSLPVVCYALKNMFNGLLTAMIVSCTSFPSSDTLPLVVETMPESRFTMVAGQRIHYWDWGSPDALVVIVAIHGWSATGAELMELARELGTASIRVLAVDLPGCGFSQRPTISLGMPGYTQFVAQWVDHVRQVLTSGKNRRLILLGHSMGGHLCINSLYRYRFGPDESTEPGLRESLARVEQLVLLAPDGLKGEEGSLALLKTRGIMTSWLSVDGERRYTESHKNMGYADVSRCPPQIPAIGWAALSYKDGMRVLEDITLDTLATDPVNERLQYINLPTLLVWGKEDRILNFVWSETWAHDLPQVRFEAIPDCGHVLQAEHPMEVGRLVRNFLNTPGTLNR